MPGRSLEILAGALVLVLAAAALIFGLNQRPSSGGDSYRLYAEFDDASGIRAGTVVEVAGVPVGRVSSIELNDFYFAQVEMKIDASIQIPEDSELVWRQSDLIGSPSLSILVFDTFSDPMQDGDVFSSVDPADNFFELLSNLAGQASSDG